jgi:drug/metabolite transporter (DMT)-like permease
MSALEYLSPGTTQVLMQLAPMLMLLGSMVLFGESFTRMQWIGVAVLVAGLVLFFSPRRHEFFGAFESFGVGIVLVLISALMWAVYLLAQKQLLSSLSPVSVLFGIYLTGSIVLFPVTQLADFAKLDGPHWILLSISCVMTVASYFSYAHAVSHVEASRVGVIFSLSPLIIFLMAWLFSIMMPGSIEPEQLTLVSISGALMVVAGSALGALGRT